MVCSISMRLSGITNKTGLEADILATPLSGLLTILSRSSVNVKFKVTEEKVTKVVKAMSRKSFLVFIHFIMDIVLSKNSKDN